MPNGLRLNGLDEMLETLVNFLPKHPFGMLLIHQIS